MQAEIILIDNNSADGSAEYLQERFPFAKIILNNTNDGFAKACNKAIQKSTGRYILFLNPDTIIPEDCFAQCISFMDRTTTVGALGIRMIDGSGKFLKESKRGFPTIWNSFCKMSGLTTLFPSSRIFAGYYMGHLSEKNNQEIDAVSGAFMMVKKEVLDKTGVFDERFFMYAEDIDLSYRIQKAGYRNYYFSGATILHFKGESTQKDARYIRLFYKAMIQFVQKHYSGIAALVLTWLLYIIIVLKTTQAGIVNKNKNKQQKPLMFAIKGDEDSIKEISGFISKSAEANNIILCAGNKFTYTQIIHEMQKETGANTYFIHGYTTNSIIGSGSKEKQGIVLTGNFKQ